MEIIIEILAAIFVIISYAACVGAVAGWMEVKGLCLNHKGEVEAGIAEFFPITLPFIFMKRLINPDAYEHSELRKLREQNESLKLQLHKLQSQLQLHATTNHEVS